MKSAPLDAAIIFTILATLRSMSEPVKWIPETFSILIEMKISMDHLNAFLLDDELSNKESKSLEHSSNIRVEIKGNFSWEPELDNQLEIKCKWNNCKYFSSLLDISGTIRDNILFGKPMEKTKYEMVTKACALDKDIYNFNHLDLTKVGEMGLNLSGG
ncbi:hypothetical protein Q3G72_031795 [Acer saccharum]|nr:hypothetical protein Q3G72_031795 [Acer saccharum]